MDDFDPADLYDADEIAEFEQRYAEELNELHEIEEEIDFNVIAKKPSQKKTSHLLDGNVFDNDFKDDLVLNSGKRSVSQVDDISSSFDEHKENTNPGGLKPKKLKLDDEPDLLYDDWDEIDAIKAKLKKDKVNNDKNKTNKTLDQLKGNSTSAILNDEDLDKNASDYNRFRQRVFSRPVFGSDLLNVTSTDGDRVFLKLCSEENLPCVEEKRWMTNSSSRGLNLLSVPFDQLKNKVQEKVHTRRMNRAEELVQQMDENLASENIIKNPVYKPGELWVEKYTPKRYTELLSDDGTNRFVLKWLKLWDQVVFGVEPEKKKPEINNDLNKGSNFPPKDGKPNFEKKKYYNPEDDLVKDSKGRPKKKIALLCGNPGLGKTTLAHVIAKHAGYQVVEMNASDDRSPEVFMNKIETSTQMKSVIGVTKKPNCLIIDEIDGAPIQAINILLDIVKSTDAAISGKGAKTKKKRKKKEFILNRPIICICNDQFVPALRQLRQVAFTLRFPTTLSSRLANRLLSIAQNECLKIDMTALLFLTDKTENDIRSCLNTLQFIQQKKKYVKQDDLKNLDVGQKDMKKGAQTILSEVFQMPKSDKKKYVKHFPGTDGASDSKSSLTNRFHYMLHLVYGNSESEKVTQGLFDQYLHSKTKDPYLESINLGTEWLVFYDILQKKVSGNQDYSLYRYLPFLPVAFHLYFARINCGKIQLSNVAYENHVKHTHNKQTVDLLINGINPHLRRNCSTDILSRDIIPYLFFVTLPNLRPVNTKLYSESEKQIFSSLVNTLISYNLTYRQERNLDGQYTYVLEPNIEELVTYPGMAQHKQLLYATKQLIGREVELEKMRKAELVMKKGELNPQNTSSSNKSAGNIVQKQKIEPKKINKFEDRPQLDFFGRVIKPDNDKSNVTSSTSNSKPAKEQKSSSVLDISTRFQFNEGYTNAVRRTIKITEFL